MTRDGVTWPHGRTCGRPARGRIDPRPPRSTRVVQVVREVLHLVKVFELPDLEIRVVPSTEDTAGSGRPETVQLATQLAGGRSAGRAVTQVGLRGDLCQVCWKYSGETPVGCSPHQSVAIHVNPSMAISVPSKCGSLGPAVNRDSFSLAVAVRWTPWRSKWRTKTCWRSWPLRWNSI